MSRKINLKIMEIAKKGMLEYAKIIEENNVWSVNSHLRKMDIKAWHKIVILNTYGWEKIALLKYLTSVLQPDDFHPMYFKKYDTSAEFLVDNDSVVVDLCRKNVTIPNPRNSQNPFKFGIILGYCLDENKYKNIWISNIQAVASKKLQSCTLNLESFHNDPNLQEFTLLSRPFCLSLVISACRTYMIRTLKLGFNDLKSICDVGLESLKYVNTLDLKSNLIEDIKDLRVGHVFANHIKVLVLDGNPICRSYDAVSYLRAVRDIFPNVTQLDGVPIIMNGVLPSRRNFVCHSAGQDFVDQFLEHFYNLYDQPGRPNLEKLYDGRAQFSLTVHHISGQNSSKASQNLSVYSRFSRNLKFISDFSKGGQNLWIGSNIIVTILKQLPPTIHDPYSFTVDLVQYTDKMAVIVVTGIFREENTKLMMNFMRTFVLKSVDNVEFKVTNDQLHINNILTSQEGRAFKVLQKSHASFIDIKPATVLSEKTAMVEVLQKITNMKTGWAKRCLEECNYDLKKALTLFVKFYKEDNIPNEAFASE